MKLFLINIILFILLQLLYTNCTTDDFWQNQDDKYIIKTSSDHLAFPDLTFYKKNWYLTFRLSDQHVPGTFSKIIVMKSSDFDNWINYKEYIIQDFDLRDPKFAYNNITDSLYLHFHGASLGDDYGQERKNFFLNFTDAINDANLKTIKTLKLPNNNSKDWLWRPIWHEGALFVGGYKYNQLQLYKFDSLTKKPTIVHKFDMEMSEATFRFYDNKIFYFSRQPNAALVGVISEGKIKNKKIFDSPIGGPNMIVLNNDSLILGCRVETNTTIYSYSFRNNKKREILNFSSQSEDCGYPGMYYKNDTIFGVYYTHNISKNAFQIKSFILN